MGGTVPTRAARAPSERLAYTTQLPVLGILTRFETNSADVNAIIAETFGTWRLLACDAATISAHVRVVVHDGTEGTSGRSPIRHGFPDHLRVTATSTGSFGMSDPARAQGIVHATSELVADRDHFRDEMLQAITLALLSSHDRHFLHAAAVGSGDRAILLAGASGTGKSTLAYLAHRSGLDVMSEDRVWIQRSPSLRVWGWPMRLHLRPEAAGRFPELEAKATQSHGSGRRRHVVDLTSASAYSPRFYANDVAVCILSRGADTPSLERIDADAVVDALTRDVAPGFDRHPERHLPSMRAVAQGGGWHLRLSSDPHQALPLLQTMLCGSR